MKIDVLLGLQWGDEGKGKIVDVLTPKYDIIARFQGGPNAGHTLEFNGRKHVLHTIPSGVFHENVVNVIGSGVVIDPSVFLIEVLELKEQNVDARKGILISNKAHLILPSHRMLDAARESSRGKSKIGSTLRGIGPAYTDKMSRNGLRIGDINSSNFKEKYEALKKSHFELIAHFQYDQANHEIDGMSFAEYEKKWFDGVEYLSGMKLIDSEHYINEALNNGKSILAEGAQGSMLDVDFGSYPYVTSSNTITAGVCTGLGVAPQKIGRVLGVFKAYCTRVGAGPFPTELDDENGEHLCMQGHEYGSTTGRKRRCGWLDINALKYSIMINGVTDLIMTKADVLSGLDTIQFCTHYNNNGEKIETMPFDVMSNDITPIYEKTKGWKEDVQDVSNFSKVPDELLNYIDRIEKLCDVNIPVVSVGPDRKEIIIRDDYDF